MTGEGGRVGAGSPRGGGRRTEPRGSCCRPEKVLGAGLGTDEQSRAQPRAAGLPPAASAERNRSLLAREGRGRTGQGGRLGSIQSKATARMKWEGGDGFSFSFHYGSWYHWNLTALKELESREGVRGGGAKMRLCVGDVVNRGGGEKKGK